MKKLAYAFIPLMSVSFLVNCANTSEQSIEHYVTFESNGGTHIETQRVKDGDTASQPTNPTRGDDAFLGWFTESGANYTFTEQVTQDITLYANWNEVNAYSVSFVGTSCQAKGGNITNYTYSFQTTRNNEDESLVISLSPDGFYQLPLENDKERFKILFNNVEGKTGDYIYDKINKQITIIKKADVLIKIVAYNPAEIYKVTIDANEGFFSGGESKIEFNVTVNSRLLPYLKSVGFPTHKLDDNYHFFTYFSYADDEKDALDYDDLVTDNVFIKANYDYYQYPDIQRRHLEDFTWKEIKNMAVTGTAQQWFEIGESKKIQLNQYIDDIPPEEDPKWIIQPIYHKVRIIGFDHDTTVDDDVISITFEFENLITNVKLDAKGEVIERSPVTTLWNDTPEHFDAAYDYRISKLNNLLNNSKDKKSIVNMLPSDLNKIIAPANKKVGVWVYPESQEHGGIPYLRTFNIGKLPKLFPLSYEEIHNPDPEGLEPYFWHCAPGEGTLYEYYKGHGGDENLDNQYRTKRIVEDDSALPFSYIPGDYWLRSPNYHTVCAVNYVEYDGVMANAIISDGGEGSNQVADIAPAFCI